MEIGKTLFLGDYTDPSACTAVDICRILNLFVSMFPICVHVALLRENKANETEMQMTETHFYRDIFISHYSNVSKVQLCFAS